MWQHNQVEDGLLVPWQQWHWIVWLHGTERHKKFVIYCTSIVEKKPDNFLDAVLVGII
jgi:hypothetical protein